MDLLNRSLLNTAGLPINENWQAYIDIEITGMKKYDGNIYVCGTYLGYFEIAKLNDTGEKLWAYWERFKIGTSSVNNLPCGIAANSSGVYVAATTSFNASVVLKFDHDGNLLFAKTFIYDSFSTKFTCIEANEDAVYVAGFRGTRAFALRLDNSGNIVWQKRYEFSTSDAIYGMSLDANDSSAVYFCGQMLNTGLSKTTGTILKVNTSDGSIDTSREVIGSGNVRLNSIYIETTDSGLATSVCGYDELSGKQRGIRTTYLGTSAYIYEHATDNVSFVSTKHTRYVTGFSTTSPSPVVLWSRGTTNAYLTVGRFISPYVNPFFKGKQFSNSHVPIVCEIEALPGMIYSAYKTGSNRGVVMKTKISTMLWDNIASTWGPTTVNDFEEQPAFPISIGNLGGSATASDISIVTGTGSLADRMFLPSSNFNYSNKAV